MAKMENDRQNATLTTVTGEKQSKEGNRVSKRENAFTAKTVECKSTKICACLTQIVQKWVGMQP